jgi:two-component system nitrogen regulation response regulator GlnG
MPAERWVLLGLRKPEQERPLREAIVEAGYRATRVQSLSECRELLKRRLFFCAFLDEELFHALRRHCPLSATTYSVLVTEAGQQNRVVRLHADGHLNDWIVVPADPAHTRAVLTRARTHWRQASELESIKSAAATAVQNDVGSLCSGTWGATASRWMERVQNSDVPAVLVGEAGTGKTLLARMLHVGSKRAGAPFVIVRCWQRDARELEREIFGEIPPRERSSSDTPWRSKFSLAANGTVLLDRADGIPRKFQQRLARAMELRKFSPVGGGDMLDLDARLIFTVQCDNHGAAWSKSFQRDLALALRRAVLHIPPLRERKSDLAAIARNVMEKLKRERRIRTASLAEDTLARLREHDWPGNIRELENVLWAAGVLAGPNPIQPKTLRPFLVNGHAPLQTEEEALEEIVEERLNSLFQKFGVQHLKDLHPMVLGHVERPLLKLVLKQMAGNQVRAAELLGINRNTLRRKITQYSLLA